MNKSSRQLFLGSLILLIGYGFFNLFNFGYHFTMARLLSIESYGAIVTILSILNVLAIFTEPIQTTLAKYSSSESDPGKLKNLVKRSLRNLSTYTLIIFILFLIGSYFLADSLEIPYTILVFSSITVAPVLLLPVTRGILQGLKRFTQLGISLFVESSLKFVLAFLLVYAGFELFGSIAAITIGIVFAFLITLIMIRDVFTSKEKPFPTPRIYRYAWSVFFVNLTVVMFYTIDTIMVKLLFSADIAGQYAIASILAKTMLWGTQPITKALFPISAEETIKNNKKNPNLYRNALLLLIGILIIVLAIFYALPELIIQLFSGKDAVQSVKLLLPITLAMAFVSIANLTLFYRLSYNGIRTYGVFVGLIIVQIIALYLCSSSIYVFSNAYLALSLIFLIISAWNYKT